MLTENYRIKNWQRSTRRLRSIGSAALGLSVWFAAGCGKDKPDSYPLTDKNGAPITAAEAKAIADANAPDAKTSPLTPEEIAAKSDKITKDTKAKRDAPTETQIGLPFYPGAEPRKNKGDLTMTTESDNAVLLTLETSDSVAKVDAFYKAKLPSAHRLQETIAGKQTIGYVDESEPGRKRGVDISAEGNKTVITLIVTRTTENASAPAKEVAPLPTTTKDAIPMPPTR